MFGLIAQVGLAPRPGDDDERADPAQFAGDGLVEDWLAPPATFSCVGTASDTRFGRANWSSR